MPKNFIFRNFLQYNYSRNFFDFHHIFVFAKFTNDFYGVITNFL